MASFRIFLSRLRNFPILLMMPFAGRVLNLILTPFMLLSFGNSGFVQVSKLLLLSYLLSVAIEFGAKQRVILLYNSPLRIFENYVGWFLSIISFFSFALILLRIVTPNSEIAQTKELVVVVIDSIINITINSFYLAYLQAKGETKRITVLNIELTLLVFFPKVIMLFLASNQPWKWILFGSIFRLLILIKPLSAAFKEVHDLNIILNSRPLKMFDKNALNSIFGLIVILVQTLDKWIGDELYDSDEMVAYILAFQFISLTGSFFEQVLIQYFTTIRKAVIEHGKNLTPLLMGMVSITFLFNLAYSIIALLTFPNLNAIFYPIISILSFQPIAWGALLIWQNILGPISHSMIHIKTMLVALVVDLFMVGVLFISKDVEILHLALITSGSFLIGPLGIALLSSKVKQHYFSIRSILTSFSFFTFYSISTYLIMGALYSFFILGGLMIVGLTVLMRQRGYFEILKDILGAGV